MRWSQQALYWRTTGWGEGGCGDVISLQKESEMEISSLSFSESNSDNGVEGSLILKANGLFGEVA